LAFPTGFYRCLQAVSGLVNAFGTEFGHWRRAYGFAGTLLALLGTWAAKGSPHYAWMATNQHIAYISDTAATSWGYPVFIAGSATSQVAFLLAFISERWLRHKGRLAHNYSTSEKALSILATIFAMIGAAGLILLTIFDTKDYHHVHDAMLVVFMCVSPLVLFLVQMPC